MVHGIDRVSITFQATGKRSGVLTVRHPRGSPRSVKVELEKVNISGQARRSVQFTGGKAVPVTTVPTTKNEWVYSGEYPDDVIDSFERADALRRLNRLTGAGAVRGGGFVKEGEKVPVNTLGEAVKGKTYHAIGDAEEDDEDSWVPLKARREAAKAKYIERAKKHNVKGKMSPQQDLDTIAMVAEYRGRTKAPVKPPLDKIAESQRRLTRMVALKKTLESKVYSTSSALDSRGNKRLKTDNAYWEYRNTLIKRINALDRGINRQRVAMDKMRDVIRSGPEPAGNNNVRGRHYMQQDTAVRPRNWTPGNIFDVRGKTVVDRAGKIHRVELFSGGWTIGNTDRMDVWAACYKLNDMQAAISPDDVPSTTMHPRRTPRSDEEKFRRMDELQLVLAKRLRQITVLGQYVGKAEDRDKTVKALEKKINALSKGKDRIRRKFDATRKTPDAIVTKKAAKTTAKRPVPHRPVMNTVEPDAHRPKSKPAPAPKRKSPKSTNFAPALTAYLKKIGVPGKVEAHKYPKGASAQYSYEISLKKRDKKIESQIDKFYDKEKSTPRDGVLRFRVG